MWRALTVGLGTVFLMGACLPLEGGGYRTGSVLGDPGGGGGGGIHWSGPTAGADAPVYRDPYGRPVYRDRYGRPVYGGSGYDPYRRSSAYDPYGRSYGYDPYQRRGDGRYFRPGSEVACDRRTETCYKDGDLDVSETKRYFGKGAGREVDRVRDRYDTDNIFRADDNVACNRDRKVCYKDGRPDRSETRDYFGKKAAKKLM